MDSLCSFTYWVLLMKKLLKHKRILIVYFLIISILFLLTECVNNENKKQTIIKENSSAQIINTVTYDQFAGSQVCGNCHKTISDSYSYTAHFYTSQPASAKTIKGSFINGKNSFKYDIGKIVSLEKQKDSFYQVYYHQNKEVVKRRFDIVIGSGKNGQTYLSWI